MLEMLCNHCEKSHRTERRRSVTVNVENTESQEQESGDSGRWLVKRTSNSSGFCSGRRRKPKKCELDDKEEETCLRKCPNRDEVDDCQQKDETATATTTIEVRFEDHRTMASGMQMQGQEVGSHNQDHKQSPERYRGVDRSYPNDDWDRKEDSGSKNDPTADGRFRSRNKRCNGSMLLLTIFCILATSSNLWDISRLLGSGSMLVTAASDQRSAGQIDKDNGICRSMDVRNNLENLEKLKGCRVIEGHLQILLIDNPMKLSFENYTYPLLTEITDFFLLFRVRGLRSLGNMFPNLAVIRGHSLLSNYALVIFEVFDLEEIGLHSLKYIGRGAVRFEKNTALCFTETVDWSRISNGTHHEANQFIQNRKENECPICPGGNNSESLDCPVLAYTKKKYACWNLQHCQLPCPSDCPWNCDNSGKCCDKSCLGGCHLGNRKNCTACRHYSLGSLGNISCMDDCPLDFYRHMGRRCITAQHCKGLRKPPNPALESLTNTFIPSERECRMECPDAHEWNGEECVICPNDRCKKVCNGGKIDSISAAQSMNGCNVVKGSLEIAIRREGGLSVVNELKRFLSKIEVIEGHLKVARSDPLVSLTFFKNLKQIKGVNAEGKPLPVSFTLMENEHLQDLFNENQTVYIENGQLNFHTNPKLCMSKIEKLRPMLSKNVKFDLEALRKGNGDRVACELKTLNVTITSLNPRGARIEWLPMPETDDQRSRLGYGIYYKQAPFKNVTLFDGRDACGFDGWLNDDRQMNDRSYVFTHLDPYTQYAFYVKTVQLATVQTGGQSDILYFQTLPDQPEKVQNARVKNSDSYEMTIAWDPPRRANGNLTTYIIKCNLTLENEETHLQRNYCIEKWDTTLNNPSLLPTPPPPPPIPDSSAPDDNCHCQKENKLPTAAETESQIEFEDTLHDYVYTKRIRVDELQPVLMRRRRRSPDDMGISVGNLTTDVIFPSDEVPKDKTLNWPVNSTMNGTYYTYIYKEVPASLTSLRLKELKHFATYTISIVACHSGPFDKPVVANCSTEVILQHRTERLAGADDVSGLEIVGNPKNNSHNTLSLAWVPPPSPNGQVLAYTIRYTRKDIDHAIGQLTCIRASEFDAKGRHDLKLGAEDGNYSIEVQVTSLGGPGEYSAPLYYRVQNPSYTVWYVLGALGLFLILLSAAIYFYIQNKKREKDHRLFAEVNPDYDATPYIPDEYEIPRERVKRVRELGQGSFGMVYAGSVQIKEDDPTETQCAIKTVNDSAIARDRINFLKEAHVMKEFHTPHVVQLLGVVSKGDPPLVVMELMALGDLKGYLRAHRPDAEPHDDEAPIPPSVRQILQMAIEIADGMAYLSYKKFVHRDLAARNCMVAADLTVKIGDFGMTRDIYETDYYRKGDKGLLPVRWMSPESLKDGVFTTSNDVFSYGVVLWEMATLASQPYQGLSNDQVLRYVIDGGVMERPQNCPDKLYQLMRRCWEHRPSNRPTFLDIVALLLDDVNNHFFRNSFYCGEEGQAHRYILQQNDNHHPDEVTTLLRPENEMSNENARENWDMPNNNNNSRRLLEEGGAMPIIKPAQSPLRFLTGKSGNDYKESKF